MRRNPFVRVRRWDQRPRELTGGYQADGFAGPGFYDYGNPYFDRDSRMQSWRRPL